MVTVAGFVEQLLNGVTLGMVYVLIAAGLSIIFGVMDVINFSHGELFALGAYFALALTQSMGSNGFLVALLIAPVVVGVVGAVIERVTLRPLYDRDPLYHVLLTFGLVLIVNDLIKLTWGTTQYQLPTPTVLNQPLPIFGVTLSLYNYFLIGLAAVLAVGTYLVLDRTRYGMIVRAGSQDRAMVRNVGIDIDRYYTIVFGFGAALAAVAGIVLGGNQSVSATMGNGVIIPAFIIVVLGGLGSFKGAVVGGLFVGIVQTLTRTFVPFFEGLTIFILMIGVLIVRPQGLFGEAASEGHHSEEGDILTGGGGLFGRRIRTRLGAVTVVGLAAFPPVAAATGNPFYVSLLSEIFVWAIFALSIDFVMGYAGLVSLGHAMFYGVGAYAAALVMIHLTSSFLVALAVGVVVCAALAWVVGSLSIRVSGVYFAMITLAFAELIRNLVFKFEFTGGSDGLLGFEPTLGIGGVGAPLSEIEFAVAGLTVTPAMVFFYLALALAVAAFLLARQFMYAPFGSVLQGIGESEDRVEFIGYDTTTYKRRAFVISGGLAGLAGTLVAINPDTFVIAPSTLFWLNSGEVIVMALLGGMGTLFGPMLGAGVFIGIEFGLEQFTDFWRLIVGVVFVVFVIFVPRGLVSIPALLVGRFREPGGKGPVVADDSEVNADD
jgi:branched-chain amino acid transport system permease protein